MSRTKILFLLGVMLICAYPAAASGDAWDRCYYCRGVESEYLPPMRGGEPVRQYGRGRPIDVKHIKLEFTLNFEDETLEGRATTTLAPVGKPLGEIVLDSIGLDISSVRASDGSELDFEVTEDKLKIFLPHPAAPGVDFSVAVTYSAKPVTGVYFRTERMGYKPEETQAWTQGEPEDARSWFPCFDYPNERATTEMIVTVPEGFMALSNGELLSTTVDEQAGTKTFHWRESVPHVSYLVSLVVGKFVEIGDSYGDIPLFYYVLPEFEEDAHLSFAKTPDMMRFFQDMIGVPYPYEMYAQVAVVDFIAGGMENTSITTLTERTLHDEAAHLTFRSDPLVAHELVHQWWGDLLTCRDWSHLWLNEGFATYFQSLWTEHDLGEDEFACEMLGTMSEILEADKGTQRAPIVRTTYGSPNPLFDVRSYSKGGWVLHMLRRELGDDLFWKCMHEYCVRHSGKVVETTDLMRTVEEVSGRGMEQFFDQWVYHGGYPELDVSYSWLNEEKLAKVVVKQTQTVDELTPLFRFTTDLQFICPNGNHREKIEISEPEHIFHVPLAERPDFVRFDPEYGVLKKLDFEKPKPMLLAQLAGDKTVVGRIMAVRALKEFKTDDVVEALRDVLLDDSFWAVRSAAARALGEIDNDKAVDALIGGPDQEDARVRLSVVEALGRMDEERVCETLLAVVGDEESPYVVARAIRALGELKCEKAKRTITRALSRDSHNEVIRRAALDALVNLEAEESLKTVARYASAGRPRSARPSAISAIGRLGKWMDKKDRPREILVELLEDPSRRVRSATVDALGELGDPKAIDDLQRFAKTTKDDGERRSAERAVERINAAREQTDEVRELRKEVDKLKKSGEEVDKRVKELESLLEAMKEKEEDETGIESEAAETADEKE